MMKFVFDLNNFQKIGYIQNITLTEKINDLKNEKKFGNFINFLCSDPERNKKSINPINQIKISEPMQIRSDSNPNLKIFTYKNVRLLKMKSKNILRLLAIHFFMVIFKILNH